MIKKYIRNLIYHSLEVISSLINFLCSLVFLYPKFELGISFLVFLECRRVDREMDERKSVKSKYDNNADQLVAEAKKVFEEGERSG